MQFTSSIFACACIARYSRGADTNTPITDDDDDADERNNGNFKVMCHLGNLLAAICSYARRTKRNRNANGNDVRKFRS